MNTTGCRHLPGERRPCARRSGAMARPSAARLLDHQLRRSVCAAGRPACAQVSHCAGLSGSDREFPALTSRSDAGTQRARACLGDPSVITCIAFSVVRINSPPGMISIWLFVSVRQACEAVPPGGSHVGSHRPLHYLFRGGLSSGSRPGAGRWQRCVWRAGCLRSLLLSAAARRLGASTNLGRNGR